MAREATKIKEGLFLSTWLPVIIFVGCQIPVIWIHVVPLSLRITLALLAIVALSCIFIWGEIWGPRNKGDRILQEYGLHPDEARILVFRGQPPRAEEASKILKETLTSESASISGGRKLLNVTGSLALALAFSYLLYVLVFPGKTPSSLVELGVDVLVPAFVFLFVFGTSLAVLSKRSRRQIPLLE
ncbi:MAG: hypothetical protein EAX95_15485 [Candidatus Thorarchaeota archaeon]|nr:hypothetical protein [Candidatus Thorarchaeota archaeon]